MTPQGPDKRRHLSTAERVELEEARQTLEAIRTGNVDAVVVSGGRGPRVFTLEGPDRPFRTFVESMEQGALTLAADDTILYCNGSFADLLKTPLERIIGSRLSDSIAPEDEGTYQQLISESRGAPKRAILRLMASDGEKIPSSLSMSVLAGATPSTWCAIVSELRAQELAREAQHAREKAEAASAAKDEFLALLTHELRTPLNSILGWTQILLRLELNDPALREGLEAIDGNARAQARLIADLVDTARIASGKLRLELQSVVVDALVREAIAAVVPQARHKSIQLDTELDSRGAVVLADPARLHQVVTNLLTNAVKHTLPGGRIDVSTRRLLTAVEIQVKDDGKGIPAEFLPKLFQKFQQAEASAEEEPGLGLGLAIVKHLAELHGGTVEGHSPGEGKGAVFTVTLPLHATDRSGAGEPS